MLKALALVLSGVFTLFLSLQAFALSCFNSKGGLTASVVRDSEKIHFRMSSERGYEFIPQVEGPISAKDIAVAQFQTDYLKALGSQFEIQMDLNACDLKRASEGVFACYQNGKIVGTDLQFSSLTAYREKQIHVSGDFETQKFRMIIGNENVFFVAIPFAVENCTGNL